MAGDRAPTVLMTADTVGGVWSYAMELAAGLAAQGGRVHLATMGGRLADAQRAQAEAIDGLELHESLHRLEWMADPWDDVDRAGRWLLGLEARLRPDVVHLNQFSFGALPFQAPVLLVAHSCVLSWWRAVRGEAAPPEWDAYRERVARGLAGADIVAAPTQAMLRTLAANYDCTRPGLVLPNGRDPEVFKPAAKRPVVLAAGRFWDEAKNLTALEAVAPQLPWPVRVAGSCAAPDGTVREPVGVQALGELPQWQLAREMAVASIYAFPARYEPFGLSVLEAALSGCALVLGDIESLRETWGEAAVYVAPDDHRALQHAIAQLIGDPGATACLADAAREQALRYHPRRMARAVQEAYAALHPRFARPALEEATCA